MFLTFFFFFKSVFETYTYSAFIIVIARDSNLNNEQSDFLM